MHAVAKRDHYEIIGLLLILEKAVVNVQNEHGWTPLHIVAQGGYKENSMKISNHFFLVLICSYTINYGIENIDQIIRTKDRHLNIGIRLISPANATCSYCKHAQRLFTPASTTKLFTAAAALHYFGTNFVFKTSLTTDGSSEDSVLNGNLYVNFSGDPSLAQQDLYKLFRCLKENNITCVRGDICLVPCIEESPEKYFGPGFCVDDIGASWNPPVSAFIVDGNCYINAENKKVAVEDPCEYVQNILKDIMKELHVELVGIVCLGQAIDIVVQELNVHESRPLKDLIAHMLKTSDNLYANVFFKVLGHTVTGCEGSWQTGSQAIKNFAAECVGIAPESWVIKDGAGLSRYNLISPEQEVRLLTWVYKQKELFPVFVDCLAISGTDGTLQKRLTDHQRIIKAKTGTLGGVSALAGYICIPEKEPYIFSILLNGFIQRAGDTTNPQINYKIDIEDALCNEFINVLQ